MEHEKDILLKTFLNRWNLKNVEKMTISEYSQLNNNDTFCYWVEYKTQKLANISGSANSFKFEIFERKDKSKVYKTDDYKKDELYSWRKRAGNTRNDAFQKTKKYIIRVINSSLEGKFDDIDSKEIKLTSIFKWKIAFLYSDKKLLAISDKKSVRWLAEQYGMQNFKNVRVSSLHRFLLEQMGENNYWNETTDMWELCDLFKRNGQDVVIKSRLRGRRGTEQKKSNDNFRIIDIHKKILISYKHNKIQNALYTKLVSRFTKKAVKMEKNFIDVRVELENKVIFFEVKCADSANLCIRMALGQVIEYAFKDNTKKEKVIIIYGNQKPNKNEDAYILHLTNFLPDLSFSYLYRLDQIDTIY
jgi:hypothetical protein